jgi:hypothetical protein
MMMADAIEEAPSRGVAGQIVPLRLPSFDSKETKCTLVEITTEAYSKVMDDLLDLAKKQIEDSKTAIDPESGDYFKALIPLTTPERSGVG